MQDVEFEVQHCESKQFKANFTADIDSTECEIEPYFEADTDHPVEQGDHVDDM